jgi:type I restriction enzyme S subunit
MSFPRYPKYKDSGVEWLGEVPEHWEIAPLKWLTDQDRPIMYGIVLPGPDVEDGIPILKGGNVRPSRMNLQSMARTTPEIEAPYARARLKRGDLVYSIRGSIGDCEVVPDELESANITQDVARVAVANGVCNKWVRWALLASAIREDLASGSLGAAVRGINIFDLKRANIPTPLPSEQVAIANYLDVEAAKIDELVAEQQRLMELLKEKRQAVISHAVTKGLNPRAPMKPSGIEWLGDVPAHWEVLELKRIATIQTGVAKGKDNGSRSTASVPYLRVANVQDGYLDLEDVATIEIREEDLSRYRLRPGDVLMNEGGDFDKLGRGCVWNGQIDPCISQNHVFAVRPRDGLSAWVAAFTGSGPAQFYFMSRSKQSTNLASISSTNLMELPLTLPPATEREAILRFIAEQTSKLDALAAEAQKAIDLLQERRTALISAAVTGQIDVRKLAAA